MTKSEFYAGFKSLFADNKQPTLADALVLMENIAKDYDERDNLSNNAAVTRSQIDTLTKENENLRQSNYKLFLSVGENAATNAVQSTGQNTTQTANQATGSSDSTFDSILNQYVEPGEKEVESLVSQYLSGMQYQESITSPFTEARRPDQALSNNMTTPWTQTTYNQTQQ